MLSSGNVTCYWFLLSKRLLLFKILTVKGKAIKRTLTFTIGFIIISALLQHDAVGQWLHTTGPKSGEADCMLTIYSTELLVGTDGVYGAIYLTKDDGGTWIELNNGLAAGYISDILMTGTILFAGTYGEGVFVSKDSGATWSATSDFSDLSTSFVGNKMISIGSTVLAGTDFTVYRTTDEGATWLQSGNGITAPMIQATMKKGNNIYVGTYGSDVFCSSDSGIKWVPICDGLPKISSIHALATDSTNLYAATDFGVYCSTNDGSSWSAINQGLVDTIINALAVDDTIVFAGTASHGVYEISKNSNSWTPMNSYLGDFYIHSLAVNNKYLFAGTPSGVYCFPLSEIPTSIQNKSSTSPLCFSLSQNYPNPFDASTTIEYYLPQASDVCLNAYNAFGEKVATLASGNASAGRHTVTFDGAELPNGIYYYRLTAGKYEQTGKMSIVH
jgi:hypothetical protein